MKKSMLLMIFMGIMLHTHAQDIEGLRKQITDMLEQFAEQQQQDTDYEELVNHLINLVQNPINLNNTNREELESLFFLTDYQIENILFYQYNNGPLLSIFELQAVEDLDMITIQRMLPFISIGETEKEKLHYIRTKFVGRIQTIIQTPKGYLRKSDSLPTPYAGSKERWLTKGNVDINGKIKMGFTLEKDPGEETFLNNIPLPDFHSGFLQLNDLTKITPKLIIGDYRLSFGQGLGLWTDMAFSKSTETAQLRRRANGLNNYTSVNESSFLRGIAMEIKWKNLELIPFISLKSIDGNLQTDSLKEEEFVTSMQETGYHRTQTEIRNRHTIKETVWGGQLSYKHHLFKMESGYANWQIDKPIISVPHLKNLHRFSGKNMNTVWLAPTIFLGRLNLFGEMTLQNENNWGFYQGLTYKPGSDIVTSIAYRRYSNGFSTILSNPFSESSIPGGESGIYTSFQFKPHAQVNIKAFGDLFSYSWLRYNTYAPSQGFEWFIQVDYFINRNNSLYIRYKTTSKEINSSISTTNYELSSYSKKNIRFYYSCHLNKQWQLNTQLEHSIYTEKNRSHGWMLIQDVNWKGKRLDLKLRYKLFDIDNYNARIYSYEPDVLYAFSVPSYQDQGSRLIINATTELSQRFRVWLRLAHTIYRNKENIGSGLQQIPGNKHTEVKFQLQYVFKTH